MTQLHERRNFEELQLSWEELKKDGLFETFPPFLTCVVIPSYVSCSFVCLGARANQILLLFLNMEHLGMWLRKWDTLSHEGYSHWCGQDCSYL